MTVAGPCLARWRTPQAANKVLEETTQRLEDEKVGRGPLPASNVFIVMLLPGFDRTICWCACALPQERMDVLLARQYNLLACLGGNNPASRRGSFGLQHQQHQHQHGSTGPTAAGDNALRVTGSGGSMSTAASKHAMMGGCRAANIHNIPRWR
jgi:hypothetical protein